MIHIKVKYSNGQEKARITESLSLWINQQSIGNMKVTFQLTIKPK